MYVVRVVCSSQLLGQSKSTCFDHYSDHLQGARMFLVKVIEFKNMLRM